MTGYVEFTSRGNSATYNFLSETKLDLTCPKCSSDQTQKITAIVSSGTTHSIGRTNSVGVASVGGKMALGTSTGTTRTTSTSVLASKLNAPVKKSESYLLAFIFVMCLFGWIPVAIFHIFGILISAGFGYWLFVKLKKNAEAAKAYNRDVFPNQFSAWDQGFYCHRCEHSFIPNEI